MNNLKRYCLCNYLNEAHYPVFLLLTLTIVGLSAQAQAQFTFRDERIWN